MAKVARMETSQCWWCKEPIQSVESFVHQMPQMEKGAKKTSQGTRNREDRWQAQAEKRWLAGFLANKRAVVPLLNFLKATEVGERERAKEK